MPTLQQYRRALGAELGGFATFAATSTAVGANAARQVIASSMANDSMDSTAYGGGYLYAVDGALAGQQRMIRVPGGFSPSTGTFTLVAEFGSTPQSGVNWELLSVLPAIRAGDVPGLKEIINNALCKMSAVDFIAVSGVTDQLRYTLDRSTYPWITKQSIIKVWQPYTSTTMREPYTGPWTPLDDAESLTLQFDGAPWRTGESFEIEVRRPANSRLKVSGTWTDQTSTVAGLSAEADEALASVNDVVAAALGEAYHAASLYGPEHQRAYWQGLASAQRAAASMMAFAASDPREINPLRGGGWASPLWR